MKIENMTKQEAILAMQQGKKVTHRHFGDGEWATMNEQGKITFEDGASIDSTLFWKDRSDSSFNEDWSLFYKQ